VVKRQVGATPQITNNPRFHFCGFNKEIFNDLSQCNVCNIYLILVHETVIDLDIPPLKPEATTHNSAFKIRSKYPEMAVNSCANGR